jgi:hypothetical protein
VPQRYSACRPLYLAIQSARKMAWHSSWRSVALDAIFRDCAQCNRTTRLLLALLSAFFPVPRFPSSLFASNICQAYQYQERPNTFVTHSLRLHSFCLQSHLHRHPHTPFVHRRSCRRSFPWQRKKDSFQLRVSFLSPFPRAQTQKGQARPQSWQPGSKQHLPRPASHQHSLFRLFCGIQSLPKVAALSTLYCFGPLPGVPSPIHSLGFQVSFFGRAHLHS